MNIGAFAACSSLVLGLAALSAAAAAETIKPGEIWPDDRGQHIQAHGGGVIKFDDTYYWFGEDRSRDNDRSLRYVSCYASKDLTHWTFRNQILKLANVEQLQRGWAL